MSDMNDLSEDRIVNNFLMLMHNKDLSAEDMLKVEMAMSSYADERKRLVDLLNEMSMKSNANRINKLMAKVQKKEIARLRSVE